MTDVTLKFSGGSRLESHLKQLSNSLNAASVVRVGFLEGANYSEGDGGARLAAAAERLTKAQQSAHPSWRPRLLAWSRWQVAHPTNLSVAQVAFWNEFGTSHTKPRPFFRNTISKRSGEWGDTLARYLKGAQFNAAIALGKLGKLISEQIRTSILNWPADNAELTVFIKGFNHGLVDRGVMSKSVDFEVVGK